MTKQEVPDDLLEEFQYRDRAEIDRKFIAFAQAGPSALHVVSDFDLTLTAGKRAGENIGTWDVMDELMPPEGVKRHSAIYNSFRPIEVLGQLTDQVAAEKWAEVLDLITSYHMNIDDVEAAFLSVAKLRDGAKDLFDFCESEGIPTVVLSSGIRDVIQVMAEYYHIHPAYILSNDLEIDETSRLVTGWRRDSLIHAMNKNEMGHEELGPLRSTRPNVLLLGDVPDDAKMVTGDTVIRVRILDPRRGEVHDKKSVQASFDANYDLVVENSLRPMVRIVRWLSGQQTPIVFGRM